jgi:hypothetical protein
MHDVPDMYDENRRENVGAFGDGSKVIRCDTEVQDPWFTVRNEIMNSSTMTR